MGNSKSKRSNRDESEEEPLSQTTDDPAQAQAPPSTWQMLKYGYAEIVNAIIRPPRVEYDVDALGW